MDSPYHRRRRRARRDGAAVENSGDAAPGGLTLLVEPIEDVLAEVAQPPSEDEPAWPGAQHAPVADGRNRNAQQLGDLLDGQQGVDAPGVAVNEIGHGGLLGVEVGPTPNGQ